MNILIVENEPSTVAVLKRILGKLEHNITAITSNGGEGVELAKDLGPDLIFINIELRGQMTGVEAANIIMKLYKIPIVFITVFIKNCLNKSLQLPEDAVVLSKPIMEEHLEYCISRAFNK